jgi:hypothetical protein
LTTPIAVTASQTGRKDDDAKEIVLMNTIIGQSTKFKKIVIMSLLMLPISLGVVGCISSSSPPPPAERTTIVVPSNSTVICSDGLSPPCR